MRTDTSTAQAPVAHPAPGHGAARAARGAVLTNYIDQFDIFLPVLALAPAAVAIYGAPNAALASALVFVATLIGRPLGSAIFGPLADRIGRSRTTRISVAGVALVTFAMALVPLDAGHAGLVALVALRFLGGVFIGGGYTAAIPLAMEWAEPRHRGALSGLIMAMSPAANATLAASTLGLLAILGPDAYAGWGWRLPFLAGALLTAALFLYLRLRVEDRDEPRPPAAGVITAAVRGSRGTFVRLFVLMTGLWLFTNIAVALLTPQLGTIIGLDGSAVSFTMLVATIVSAVAMVATGAASTRIGRHRLLFWFGVVAAVAAPLTILGVFRSSGVMLVVLVALLQVITVAAYGPIGAHLAEQFPRTIRATGYGLAYSTSIILPALYPYYLPPVQQLLGVPGASALMLGIGGVLVAIGAWRPRVIDRGPARGRPLRWDA